MPGRPPTAAQNSGAMTPSLLFSARLSRLARARSGVSACVTSRPTIIAVAARAPARSPAAKGTATARRCWSSDRAATRGHASTAATHGPSHAWISAAGISAASTTTITVSAPLARRARPRFRPRSSAAISRPAQVTGCPIRR
mgnify:CR=1 FL=1